MRTVFNDAIDRLMEDAECKEVIKEKLGIELEDLDPNFCMDAVYATYFVLAKLVVDFYKYKGEEMDDDSKRKFLVDSFYDTVTENVDCFEDAFGHTLTLGLLKGIVDMKADVETK